MSKKYLWKYIQDNSHEFKSIKTFINKLFRNPLGSDVRVSTETAQTRLRRTIKAQAAGSRVLFQSDQRQDGELIGFISGSFNLH